MGVLIALDAGHHLGNPKCVWKQFDPAMTREWVLNDRMARHVERELSGYDCHTVRVDDPLGKTLIKLAERNRMANAAGADYLISIHHNGGIKGGSGGGITVYRGSKAGETSLRLQREVYEATVRNTGLQGNRASPMAVGRGLGILNGAGQPAILGEFGFMDSSVDAPVIITDGFSRACAAGIVEALVNVAGLKRLRGGDDMAIMEELRKVPGCGGATERDVAEALGYMLRNRAPAGDAAREFEEAIKEGLTDGSAPGMPIVRWMAAVLARRAAGRR